MPSRNLAPKPIPCSKRREPVPRPEYVSRAEAKERATQEVVAQVGTDVPPGRKKVVAPLDDVGDRVEKKAGADGQDADVLPERKDGYVETAGGVRKKRKVASAL